MKDSSSTTFKDGSAAATSSTVATGKPVLVLGTTDGTTITAADVTMNPTAIGSKTSAEAGVVAFHPGSPSASKVVGDPPSDYTEGDGTIVSGKTAYGATTAAITACPGIIVDRVVKLADGDYEVHCIGVNWPHHIFLNPAQSVIGAD